MSLAALHPTVTRRQIAASATIARMLRGSEPGRALEFARSHFRGISFGRLKREHLFDNSDNALHELTVSAS